AAARLATSTARLDAERAQQALAQQVAAVLRVRLVEKQVTPPDLAAGSRIEIVRLAFDLQNLADQPIVRVAGTMHVTDGFAGDLVTLPLDVTTPISAGDMIAWEASVGLGLQSTTVQRLTNAAASQLTASFSPEVVELAD